MCGTVGECTFLDDVDPKRSSSRAKASCLISKPEMRKPFGLDQEFGVSAFAGFDPDRRPIRIHRHAGAKCHPMIRIS